MVQTPADAARSAAKMAAAEAYLGKAQQSSALSNGSGLDSTGGSLTSWSTWQAMVPSAGKRTASTASLTTAAAAATSSSAGVAHIAQTENYYCGPASGLMILTTWGAGASVQNGVALTQDHVAGAAHMQTKQNGQTSWASHLFRIGLNHWLYGTDTGFFVDQPAPTNAQFSNSLVTDINLDVPIGVSTYEAANLGHYNHHPVAQEVGHWIVGQGYSDSGNTASFDDPAANSSALSSAWDSVAANFTATVASFNPKYVSYHGITW